MLDLPDIFDVLSDWEIALCALSVIARRVRAHDTETEAAWQAELAFACAAHELGLDLAGGNLSHQAVE